MRPDIHLETKNLTVGYRTKRRENQLFSNLNVSLRAGGMVCFMGPNGAGKSSLLRTLAGLQRPLSGSVELGETGQAKSHDHQVAVVLTDPVHAVNLSVHEVVSFGRYPYLGWNIRLSDADKNIIDNAIEQVHLRPLLEKKLYELSDGQRQMVMIARALAQDTPVMLLDEPTAHLDLNNRVEIMNLLKQLSRTTGKSILLATHELDLALQTADLIWLTGSDRNIIEGLPEDLVLSGVFDEIFKFKGFDLRSGKVLHEPFRKVRIHLSGVGPPYLWTKNALERNGFEVTDEQSVLSVSVQQEAAGLKWTLNREDISVEVKSIEELVKNL